MEMQRALLGRMLDSAGWRCSDEIRHFRAVPHEVWLPK